MKNNQHRKLLKNVLFIKKINKIDVFSLGLPIKKDATQKSSIINKQQLKYFLKQKAPNTKNQLPSNLLFSPLSQHQIITTEDKNLILFFYKNNLFFPNQIQKIDWTIINKNFSFFYNFLMLLKILSTKK